ncbi:MAG: UvrB/UvrC motif-containing protein [Solirubrobacterales bacterium]
MLCERCKKNEATYHITKIIDNVKQELNLCEKCTKESAEIGFIGKFDLYSPLSFQNLISGLMEYISQPGEVEKAQELNCSNCGMPYNEFKKNGYLGCSECYISFENEINPVIKRVQGNLKHTGKIPRRIGKDIISKNEVDNLKILLHRAIESEEYEKAAEIRDQIKKIQNIL